ncbi:MAG: PAS domain S-box-containing protein [Planctomycetaceae bacterium]|jgi:PAS domain S-box-containing protein
MSTSSHLTGVARDGLAWQLIQAMPEAVILVDPDSLAILATNAATERLTGQRSTELLDQQVSAIIETVDGTSLPTIWRDSQKLSSDQPSKLIHVATENGHRTLSMTTTCSAIEADGHLIIMIVIRDDTELVRLRKIETEHRENAAKLEEVFQAFEGFAWEYETSTSAFTYVSPRAEEIFGYPTSAWIGDPDFFPKVIHPEDRESVLNFCDFETAAGSDHSMTYRMQTASGDFRWVRDIVYLSRDDTGLVRHLRGIMIDITNEHQLRDQLVQSEERFRRLYDESPIAQFQMDWSGIQNRLQEVRDSGVSDLRAWLDEFPEEVVDLSQQARITAVNCGALEMFEIGSSEEFAGSLGAIFKADSLKTFKEHILFRVEGGRTFEAENVAYTLSGKRIHIHIRANLDADTEQSWRRIYASVTNITQRRHAEILRDGQRRVLESLATVNTVESVLNKLTSELERQSPNIHATVFRTSPSGTELRKIANGNTAEEIVTLIDSVRIDDLFSNSDKHADIHVTAAAPSNAGDEPERILPSVVELVSRAINACNYKCGVMRLVTNLKDQPLGQLVVFHKTAREFTPHEKEAIDAFTDLTGLVLQHDQHRRSLIDRTNELQSVVESYPDALLRISSHGTIIESYSGNELTELLKLSETPSGQILWHLLPSAVSGQVRAAIENVSAGNHPETIQFSVDQNEDQREFEIRFLPLPSTSEQIAILRDVTLLKQVELKLTHASEQFRYLFENSPDAIFVETPDGKVLDANQTACDLHKLSRDQLIGHDVLALIPAGDRGAAASRSQSLVSGEISEFESHSLQSDGQIVPVGVRISTITYNGSPAVLLHVRDITRQKQEEERHREHEKQLAHVSRLTMMGQLVAGIAHEIRQPLWSLSTFADVCVEALDRPDFEERLPQIRNVASKVVSEARRVNAITTRMFSFARKGTAERTSCNIADIANDAVQLTAGRARSSRIKTTLHLDDELPAIQCDRVLIEQTFANLLNNAYAAMSTHPSDSRQVNIEIILDAEDHNYVSTSVRDNGPGLPDGVVPEQLFEGFFTTGQTGLGIGLALSRSFVEDHGGTIRAEQSPEGGLEFVFTLRVDGGKHADAD